MPAVIPTRPVSGATVASAWGTDVHDRIYTPRGVIASGAQVNAPADAAVIPMDTIIAGAAGLIGANAISITGVNLGLWRVDLAYEIVFAASPNADWFIELIAGAGPAQTIQTGGHKSAGVALRHSVSALLNVQADSSFYSRWRLGVCTYVKLTRGSFVRVGNVLG